MDSNTLHELTKRFKGNHFNGKVETDISMKEHTTIHIGGLAPLWIEPADVSSLLAALRILTNAGVAFFVIGGGSNLIVSDAGFDCAVISTRSLDAIRHSVGEDGTVIINCGAGTSMSRVVEYCTAHTLTGMEQFAGLPGTAGGAVYMNARCFDRQISDVLIGADYVEWNGGLDMNTSHINSPHLDSNEVYQKEQRTSGGFDTQYSTQLPCGAATLSPLVQHYGMNHADWDYKVSPFQNTARIITQVAFHLQQLNSAERSLIEEKCKHYIDERRNKGHFRAPSAGSVFRNNHSFGKSSGALVDDAGLRGFAIGGAQIAPWHGNFIINTGNATSADVSRLVQTVQDTIRSHTGYALTPEIVFAGIPS